ncbi:MAG: acylase [Pedobacter sp.]|nr:MAG: acylase [Pedobacter sp.]
MLSSTTLLQAQAKRIGRFTSAEIKAFETQAQQVQIIRDQWGIPHVYGKTDADAVFGLMYAQSEDDFKRIELNYIEKLGRLAEINGPKDIYNDLQIRLLIDSNEAIADYQAAEPWFKKLLDAHAAGLNYYLYKNPHIKPALLTKFQPWYALLWTDGSIGAINTAGLTVRELQNFYTGSLEESEAYKHILKDQQSGSNGFAFGPQLTASGKSILYLNPHTTFYFRPEVQMQSEEGLNIYGAVTWGQFFVYQGFNEFCGWMHTSNNVDIADIYAEKIIQNNQGIFYEYDQKLRPIGIKNISIKYQENGQIHTQTIPTYYTHNGPIMALRDKKWISLKHANRNTQSLIQSWVRTKAKSFAEFQKAMDLTANSSNNTVYADAAGNIAYWHGNFIPKRNPALNWAQVQDGSLSANGWQGLHPVSESVHIYNPPTAWLQNCNSTPFTAAGSFSPQKENYPPYMAPDGDNFRGLNAVRLLQQISPKELDLNKVIAIGYNTYLPAFEYLIPALKKAHQTLALNHPLKKQLQAAVDTLSQWNYYSASNSVATTLAYDWAQNLMPSLQKVYIDQGEKDQVQNTIEFAAQAKPEQLLEPLAKTLAQLIKTHGKWQMPWGEINRFQRLTGQLKETYDDNKPSYPVAFGSGMWGQLPSYRSSPFNTAKRYGTSGNSFVCVVEFGERIKAKSVLAGGNSGNPQSPHFNDQAELYSKGEFKDVLFYKEDVKAQARKTYKPGEE